MLMSEWKVVINKTQSWKADCDDHEAFFLCGFVHLSDSYSANRNELDMRLLGIKNSGTV